MAERLELEIVTPERRVLARQVDDVTLPSVDGYMGVLPGHAALLAELDIGELSYLEGGTRQYLAVSGGFVEILRNTVSVLAETSETAEEIDLARAQKAREAAQGEVNSARLKRAVSRIQVHGRLQR